MLQQSTGRIAALDGLRGIAILLVLVEHANLFSRAPFPEIMGIGQHGVTLFFVLSGYLITSRLATELSESGTINLRSFYLRRFFRLMPAAWTYLAVMAIFGALHRPIEILSCLFFFRNYPQHLEPSMTGQFWTLSIEEQFYLFWPACLLFLSTRRSRTFAICLALAIATWRILHWVPVNDATFPISTATEYRADALLVGCIFALLPHRFARAPRKYSALLTGGAVTWAVLCALRYKWWVTLQESVALGIVVWIVANGSFGWLNRFLSTRPLATIGVLSYSIYLWQQVCFIMDGRVNNIPFGLACTTAMAVASYYLIERPCIRFGANLAQKTKSSHSVPVSN